MIIDWEDINILLEGEKASQNEINALRQIWNCDSFQILLVADLGIVTDSFLNLYSINLSTAAGTIEDLGALDLYELVDFIEDNKLTLQQASSISPQQMCLLGEDQVSKVSQTLMVGLDEEQDPIRYSLSVIVQTGFPYKRIKGKQHYERTNGNMTVTMSAPNDIGVPSGMYPRLAFVHICSEIVKKQSRSINLGPSLKRFVTDELGRSWSTGKKGTAGKWIESMTSLLGTSFTTTHKVTDKNNNYVGLTLENVSIADKAILWWDKEFDDLKGAEIKVSEAFYDALTNHATPLDVRALSALSEIRSPLAFDLYCWLTFRFWAMEESKTPIIRISWKQLYEQLGTGISTIRHFISDVQGALIEVKKVYPQASFNCDQKQYLMLFTSPPHISPKRLPKQQSMVLESP